MAGWVDDGMDDAWMNGVQYVFMFFNGHSLYSALSFFLIGPLIM